MTLPVRGEGRVVAPSNTMGHCWEPRLEVAITGQREWTSRRESQGQGHATSCSP